MHLKRLIVVIQFYSSFSFEIIQDYHSSKGKSISPGDSVTLLCKSDSSYEYCSWSHKTPKGRVRECHFEWKRAHNAVKKQDCSKDFSHKVSMTGNYDKHQCGIRIQNVKLEDAGEWICEMESYVFMMSKGDGYTASKKFQLEVVAPTTTTTSTTESTTVTTEDNETEETTTDDDVLVFTTQPDLEQSHFDHDYEDDDYNGHDEDYQYIYHDDIMEDEHEDKTDDQEDTTDEHHVEEHSEFMTENGDQVNYADSIIQIEEEDNSSGSLVGIIVGVVVGVLAAGGVVAGVLVWKKKRGDAGVVTMSKILEDSEARGHILEESEYHAIPSTTENGPAVL